MIRGKFEAPVETRKIGVTDYFVKLTSAAAFKYACLFEW